MPNLTGYYNARPQFGAASSPIYRDDGQLDEAALRGGGRDPGAYTDAQIAPAPTYTNGNHFAGTNVPMSDQAYSLLTANGGQLPTDRDVLGGGKFGVRGWMNDHPLGVIAAFTALAAGGAAATGGLGGASGSGAASGAGSGTVGWGGAGTGGFSGISSLPSMSAVGGGNAGALAAGGGISGGAGIGLGGYGASAGGGVMNSALGGFGNGLERYAGNLSGLLGGNSSGSNSVSMPSIPSLGILGSPASAQTTMTSSRQDTPLNQTFQRSREYMRTPINFRGATIWV